MDTPSNSGNIVISAERKRRLKCSSARAPNVQISIISLQIFSDYSVIFSQFTMNGCPRSQFHLPPQYGGRQTIPFHTGFGAFVPPRMPHGGTDGGHGPHSYFGRPTNGVLNGYSFQQPSKQAPNVVQRYLDINCNESHGNYEMVR